MSNLHSTVSVQERKRVKAAMPKSFPNWRTAAGFPTRDVLLDNNIDWTLRGWRIENSEASNLQEFRLQNQ